MRIARRSFLESEALALAVTGLPAVIGELSGCMPRPSAKAPEASRSTEAPWYTRVQVISVGPLDEGMRRRFGVDMNGVWTGHTMEEITKIHAQGGRALRSLEVIIGEKNVTKTRPDLERSVSKDIFGKDALATWYTWEDELPRVLSINSPAVQSYILAQAEHVIDIGADALFIDEHQTSSMLVSTDRHAAGFGPDDIAAFNRHLASQGYTSLAQYLSRKSYGGSFGRDKKLGSLFKLHNPQEFSIAAFLRAKISSTAI